MPDLREHLAPEPVEALEQLALTRAGDLDDEGRHAYPLELGHRRPDRAGIAGGGSDGGGPPPPPPGPRPRPPGPRGPPRPPAARARRRRTTTGHGRACV